MLSQALSGLACLAFMVRRFPILRMQGAEKRFDLHSAKVLCWMGIPMGLQYSITAVGSIILQSAVTAGNCRYRLGGRRSQAVPADLLPL